MSGKKRALDKMSQKGSLFSGLSILFAGLPVVRVKIFTSIITAHGGQVLTREKKRSSLQPSTLSALDFSLDYIIVDKSFTSQALCDKLNCLDIPSSIAVVKTGWLEQCVAKKRLLDHAPFDAICDEDVKEVQRDTDSILTTPGSTHETQLVQHKISAILATCTPTDTSAGTGSGTGKWSALTQMLNIL
jgi:hypothetical protein